MGVLDRIADRAEISRGMTLDQYLRQIANNGQQGYWAPTTYYTPTGKPAERLQGDFQTLAQDIYAAHPVIFGLMEARRSAFSEARFCWRAVKNGNPGDVLPINDGLELLEKPWAGATTSTLLNRMRQDSDLGGTAYVVRQGDRLRRLRPDWVYIVLSGDPWTDPFVDFLGITYAPNGPDNGPVEAFLPDEVIMWAPTPDPLAQFRGMSWLTPVLREIAADKAATAHRDSTLRQGAWLGPIVRPPTGTSLDQFKRFVEAADAAHSGPNSAGKMVFLAPGSEITTVAQNFRDLDIKAITGAVETRLSVAARVPAVIAGISEGLQGSSLNAGNYQSAKRAWIAGSLRPDWRSLCESVSVIIDPPDLSGIKDIEPGTEAQLWILESDIALLHEDRLEAAQVRTSNAQTINTLITAGYTPESIVVAVRDDDLSALKHSGLTSVQLSPPGQNGDQTGQFDNGGGFAPDTQDQQDFTDTTRSRISRATGDWSRHPHPGQQYKHGWIKIGSLDDIADAVKRWDADYRRSGDALGSAPLGISNADEVLDRYQVDDPEGLLDHLSPEKREQVGRALFGYAVSEDSASVNEGLRRGESSDVFGGRYVEGLDAAMDVSKLANPVDVYRGIIDPRKVFGDAWNDDDVTGLTWDDGGYLSTTADERIATDFSMRGVWQPDTFEPGGENYGRAAVMHIVVPEGTGAVRLSDWNSGQAEVLLERGLRLRVVRDDGIGSDGIRRLDVEVVRT